MEKSSSGSPRAAGKPAAPEVTAVLPDASAPPPRRDEQDQTAPPANLNTTEAFDGGQDAGNDADTHFVAEDQLEEAGAGAAAGAATEVHDTSAPAATPAPAAKKETKTTNLGD